jgi:Fe-S-cluster containining protein
MRDSPGWSIPEGWFLEIEEEEVCPFVAGNLCGIHPIKPDGCRLFEAGTCPGYLGKAYLETMETE